MQEIHLPPPHPKKFAASVWRCQIFHWYKCWASLIRWDIRPIYSYRWHMASTINVGLPANMSRIQIDGHSMLTIPDPSLFLNFYALHGRIGSWAAAPYNEHLEGLACIIPYNIYPAPMWVSGSLSTQHDTALLSLGRFWSHFDVANNTLRLTTSFVAAHDVFSSLLASLSPPSCICIDPYHGRPQGEKRAHSNHWYTPNLFTT